jgi:serine protease inhibitor ecotin
MKKITVLALCAIAAMMFTSCAKLDEKSFVGTWGVEKIEYYNVDYAGNPISGSMSTFVMVPGDQQSGIDLIFREDMTGEMRDRSQDTIKLDYDEETDTYETIIVCPDTTLVTKFTYSVDGRASILYMNLTYPVVRTYKMNILNMGKDSFVYENEYWKDYVEKAYMKRLSNSTSKSANRSGQSSRPRREGSLFSDR